MNKQSLGDWRSVDIIGQRSHKITVLYSGCARRHLHRWKPLKRNRARRPLATTAVNQNKLGDANLVLLACDVMHIPRTCNKQYHRAPTRGIPAQTTIKLRFPSLSVVVFIKPLTFHCALTAGGGKRLMQRSPSLTYHAQQTSLAPDLQGGDSSAARVVWTWNLRSDYYILL